MSSGGGRRINSDDIVVPVPSTDVESKGKCIRILERLRESGGVDVPGDEVVEGWDDDSIEYFLANYGEIYGG